jgi:hypothetical protein
MKVTHNNKSYDLGKKISNWQQFMNSIAKKNVSKIGKYPKLYFSGVVYRKEPTKQENWQGIESVMGAGQGDCEDLTCIRVAELLAEGIDAQPKIVKTGKNRYHAIVGDSAGNTIEDPSRILINKERIGSGKQLVDEIYMGQMPDGSYLSCVGIPGDLNTIDSMDGNFVETILQLQGKGKTPETSLMSLFSNILGAGQSQPAMPSGLGILQSLLGGQSGTKTTQPNLLSQILGQQKAPATGSGNLISTLAPLITGALGGGLPMLATQFLSNPALLNTAGSLISTLLGGSGGGGGILKPITGLLGNLLGGGAGGGLSGGLLKAGGNILKGLF